MEVLIGVVGGLGLFLFGMQVMSAGLQKSAGKKMEKIIELLTRNRFMGVIVGTVVTGVIQSSSATTVMVVGFVNAGMMKLTQAVGVIMGANIGTTITGQIVSLSVDQIAPIAVGMGMILWMTAKKDKQKNFAEILIGLGILFIGMEFLKDSLKPLRELEAFNHLMTNLSSNPILGVLIGLTLTFVVQSSSASIGMLIALASQGILPLAAALPILYGDNMGTCTTALLSSIGASKNAKRAAIIHMAFNFVGTVIFVVFLSGPITHLVTSWDPTDVGRQIANAHTIFNISNVVIQFPFAFVLIKIAMLLVPDKGDEENKKLTKFIDDRILETPHIALNSAVQETVNMGQKAQYSLSNAMDALFSNQYENIKETFKIEKDINVLEKDITEYLVKLSNCDLMDEDRKYVDSLFNAINDIERIGDHADNIAEIIHSMDEFKIVFSDSSTNTLIKMHETTAQTLALALEVIESPDEDKISKIFALENEMDILEKDARRDHFTRLHNQECDAESGIYYLEIINNLERVSDLSSNLAKMVSENIA
ncbi:MAG: Na/Pi cotransporter family protein [Clostridia bacterium]|nr:Na/Pi cotransporter family protein [Clostridia bacterium]